MTLTRPAAAFKPTLAAPTPFSDAPTNGEPTNGTKPPPPPPSERRPARRRSSAEAMLKRLDRSPSPTQGINTQASATAAGKSKARLSRGKADHARSEPGGEADGLDGLGTSLEVELGNERGRWKDMVVQGDPTPVKDGSNQVSTRCSEIRLCCGADDVGRMNPSYLISWTLENPRKHSRPRRNQSPRHGHLPLRSHQHYTRPQADDHDAIPWHQGPRTPVRGR